ncbi:hypothetical protein SAMN04488054_1152 [Salibacterium qingdaonense]|uniref:Uncharacterized protein n=1 Tax=Salibacterium qingdaonense TaxID=266892 RepID=A0A1I4N3I5_9BACI|nr:hypothetical protein SAMN04488054_1152 [Salibacterium qingdaonense]
MHSRFKHKKWTIGNLTDIIDSTHQGIYAYPPESEKEREETRRLMHDFMKKKERAAGNASKLIWMFFYCIGGLLGHIGVPDVTPFSPPLRNAAGCWC